MICYYVTVKENGHEIDSLQYGNMTDLLELINEYPGCEFHIRTIYNGEIIDEETILNIK